MASILNTFNGRGGPAAEVKITKEILEKLVNKWRNYLLLNPYKLFIEDNQFKSFRDCIASVERHSGFQVIAFAGKAQNESTHPNRLPGLGELSLLTKIKTIQLITHKPARIIFDGEYYADIFGEKVAPIIKYQEEIKKLGKLLKLNQEFPKQQTFLTVKELLAKYGLPATQLDDFYNEFAEDPDKTFEEFDIYPRDLIKSIAHILPTGNEDLTREELREKAKQFILRKAALAKAIEICSQKDDFQRITILQYSKANYPRLNMELNSAPWNSTLLLKNSYLNINTATSGEYEELKNDSRNNPIIDENGYFWGFTRNENIFKDLS